ncbi:MAG: ribbon-helix-helix domain-containing protein [Rhodomicrobium sp.]
MSKSDDERSAWLSSQMDKTKAARPDPEKRDVLHNRQPDPRQGRKILSAWIKPAAIRQFKTLAFNEDKSHQAMMEEALNLLFRKYNMPEIA